MAPGMNYGEGKKNVNVRNMWKLSLVSYFTNASQLRPFNNAFPTMLYLIGRLSSIGFASVTEPRNCTYNLVY